jgi:hypothetical protein
MAMLHVAYSEAEREWMTAAPEKQPELHARMEALWLEIKKQARILASDE